MNNITATQNINDNAAAMATPRAKLSLGEKFSYGMGAGAEVIMANIIFKLAMPIYNVGLGVDAAMLGLWLLIPRLWDAISDPFIGNLSDNTRSRWGRRKPYILAGTIFTGVLCMLLWMPPRDASQTVHLIYFAAISLLYFTTYALFFVSFNALGYEMTDNYDERTSVMGYKWSLSGLGALIFLPGAYMACFWFGKDEVEGARVVGVIMGLGIIFFGLFPLLFCKERFKEQKQEKMPFTKALLGTAKNKPFVLLCGVILTVLAGIFIAIPLQFYINMAYICPGNKELTSKMLFYSDTVYSLVGFASIPLITYAAKRIGKKQVLVAGLVLVAAGVGLSWFYLTPKMPYLQVIFGLIVSPGMSCVWVMTSSCIADVCDFDEMNTGLRREGMYGAVFGWIMKTGLAAILGISGLIIKWSGFTVGQIVQSPETVIKLRSVFAFAPLCLFAIAIVFALKYPVTKEKINEIQRVLSERKYNT